MRRNATSQTARKTTTTPPADLNLLVKRARAARPSISVLTIPFVSPRQAMEPLHGVVALMQLGKAMIVRDIVEMVSLRYQGFPSIEFSFFFETLQYRSLNEGKSLTLVPLSQRQSGHIDLCSSRRLALLLCRF